MIDVPTLRRFARIELITDGMIKQNLIPYGES